MDTVTQESFDTVMAFMGAMGAGDMEKMRALMADDMVLAQRGRRKLAVDRLRHAARRQSSTFLASLARIFRQPLGTTQMPLPQATPLQSLVR